MSQIALHVSEWREDMSLVDDRPSKRCANKGSQAARAENHRDRAVARQTLPRMESGPRTGEALVDLDLWTRHVALARTGDPALRAELFARYQAQAASLARKMHRGGEPLEDLTQIAMEALLRALDRFDPGRRRPFMAFANPTIVGSLKRHYRDSGWSIRVSRRAHELAGPAAAATERLSQRLGRAPLNREVAAELDIRVEELLELREATAARSVSSLDGPISDADGATRADLIGGEDPGLHRAENHVALQQALVNLNERDRSVLKRYYVDGLAQTDIAEEYGVSQMQVSRWITSSVKRLSSHLCA